VFEVAEERGIAFVWPLADAMKRCLNRLDQPHELLLLKMLGEYPTVLAASAQSLEPHLIPYYLHDLVSTFHSYYNQNRILGDDVELSMARLCLAAAVRDVVANALALLGVDAPRKM
jgi:arginyl-tRNA synthetase